MSIKGDDKISANPQDVARLIVAEGFYNFMGFVRAIGEAEICERKSNIERGPAALLYQSIIDNQLVRITIRTLIQCAQDEILGQTQNGKPDIVCRDIYEALNTLDPHQAIRLFPEEELDKIKIAAKAKDLENLLLVLEGRQQGNGPPPPNPQGPR